MKHTGLRLNRAVSTALTSLMGLLPHSLPLAAPTFAIAATATVGTVLVGCESYDQLVDKDTQAERAWADLDANLQRRADLIPNLVNVVKGSAKHEQATLAAVTEARSQASSIKMTSEDLQDPEKMAAFQKAQENLKGSLSRLLVIQEQYPDLKANQSFRDLQVQLESTENRILRAREVYNAAAADYNGELKKIRGTAINKITGKPFKPRVFFAASADAQKAPEVAF